MSDAPHDSEMPEHLVSLPGGHWCLWRSVVLRGAGFPATGVLRLAEPECAAVADRLLAAEEQVESIRSRALGEVDSALDALRERGEWGDKAQRKPLMKALQFLARGKLPKPTGIREVDELREVLEDSMAVVEATRQELARAFLEAQEHRSEVLKEVAASDSFREAVTWQNRHAVATALDALVRGSKKGGSQRRQHEELVASYLQRYCTKNDTIGFFGPVSWAELSDEGAAVQTEPGEELLEQRRVYFESWCIDALAQKLGERIEIRPSLAPRLKVSCHLEGDRLYRPLGEPLHLSSTDVCLLAACDGESTALEIADRLVADPEMPITHREEVYQRLDDLCKRRILTWTLEVPMELHPDQRLRSYLERIQPEVLRTPALAALEELVSARDAVQSAAGDAVALATAMEHLETVFHRRTGLRPRRNAGQTYGARGLVYEDCRRNLDVRFGPQWVERLGPPLTLVLRSARWMAGQLGERVEMRLAEIFDDLCKKRGTDTLDSYSFFTRGLTNLFFKRQRDACFEDLQRDFQQRWARVLAWDEGAREARHLRYTTEELLERFDENFREAGLSWSLSGYFSPDAMVVTDSEEAFAAGDFEIVLGETHTSNTMTWSCFISQHPEPQKAVAALVHDLGTREVVLTQVPKQNWTQRMMFGLVLPEFYHYAFVDEPLEPGRGRVLSAGSVVVERQDDRLVARTQDGSLRFPIVELFGFHLVQEANAILGSLVPSGSHRPRINVDDVVVSREGWKFQADALEFAHHKTSEKRFLEARRWAQEHGMPRFCFFKVSWERKPCYLDFDSPIFVDLFAKMVRSADPKKLASQTVSVSEMLPRLDQAWLKDAAGNLYTSELRLTALEVAQRETP